jgi:methyl-coenzyme M reductase subunit C
MPKDEDIKTEGTIDDIVTGVIRGETISQEKLDEIIRKVKLALGDA